MTIALLAAAIVVSHAWIAAPPTGAPTAAAYATVTNDGKAPDALIGAETPAADGLKLHSMSMADGIMRMRPATSVAIAPGATLSLNPGGAYHFMLMRPKHPLKAGDRIPATLIFDKAGAVKTVFVVQAPPAAPHITLR
jgi:copper(I)-binding protein